MRLAFAENPNTPDDLEGELLAQLANNTLGSRSVLEAVAGNPSTPADTLAQLAYSTHERVDKAVAGNPSTPADTLAQLANDYTCRSRFCSSWHGRDVRQAVAGNPSTPADTLAQLANDRETVVQLAVATNPNTQVELLAQLASDNDQDVHIVVSQRLSQRLSRHLSATERIIFKVGLDHSPELLWAKYQYLTLSGLSLIFELGFEEEHRWWGRSHTAATMLADHPLTPLEFIQTMASSPEVGVRVIVASSPRTPTTTLTTLTRDNHPDVRRAATAELNRRQ